MNSDRKNTRKNKHGPRLDQVMRPTEYNAQISVRTRIRYYNDSSAYTSVTITRGALLDSIIMATGSTSGYRINSAVKLNKIEIFGQPPGAGTSVPGSVSATSSVTWLSTYAPQRVVTSTGLGTSYGAHISTSPPRMSLAGYWSLTGQNESEALCVIAVHPYDLIDLYLQYTILGQFGMGSAVTLISATVGQVYYPPLDYQANLGSSTLLPVALPSVL